MSYVEGYTDYLLVIVVDSTKMLEVLKRAMSKETLSLLHQLTTANLHFKEWMTAKAGLKRAPISMLLYEKGKYEKRQI